MGDETRFLTEFQKHLKDCFTQIWFSILEAIERYEVDRTFKSALKNKKNVWT